MVHLEFLQPKLLPLGVSSPWRTICSAVPVRTEHLMRRLCFHSLCSSAVTPELKCIFWVAYVKVVSLLASLAIACKFSFVFYVLVEKENCLDS